MKPIILILGLVVFGLSAFGVMRVAADNLAVQDCEVWHEYSHNHNLFQAGEVMVQQCLTLGVDIR